MKKVLFSLIVISVPVVLYILFFHTGGIDNSMKIKSIQELEIYDTDPFKENQQISDVTKATIDKDTLKKCFEDVEFHKGSVIWKGQSLGVGKLDDGSEIRLAISYYGGFLKIIGESGYYQLKGESRKLFEKTRRQIVTNKFIPARKSGSNSQ